MTMFLDKDRDHCNSLWSTSYCNGQREMRDWLWKLWIGKPGLRELIWKVMILFLPEHERYFFDLVSGHNLLLHHVLEFQGGCIALNTNKCSTCMEELCVLHNFPLPADEE